MEAQEWCKKYQRSGNVKDLTQAWDLYYHVFRRISKQLPQVLSSVCFQFVHIVFMNAFILTSPCPAGIKLRINYDN